MDIERIGRLLPERPRKGMLEYVKENCDGELGPEYAIFNRESITLYGDYFDNLSMLMTPEQVEEAESKLRNVWGANVKCTYCGEEYYAGYTSKPQKGVIFAEGEDGSLCPGWVDGKNPMSEITVNEGYIFGCPICGKRVELVHKSQLRNGRTFQVQVCSVEVVEQYTALVFWLIGRTVNEYGYSSYVIKPQEALVLDEKCRFKRYVHKRQFMDTAQTQLISWVYRSGFKDSFQRVYYDWPSFCHRKIGGMCWTDVPDLCGTTGEKTGIREYIEADGNWPAVYLKTWKNHPQIENLLKCGFGLAVVTEINDKVNTDHGYGWETKNPVKLRFGNWDEVKPAKMLGFTKQEIRSQFAKDWNHEVMFEWWGYRNTENHSSADVFDTFYRKVGLNGLKQVNGLLENGEQDLPLPKLMRYLDKFHDLRHKDTLQYLIDVRVMSAEMSPDGEVPSEFLWPKNLIEVHDRLDRVQRSQKNVIERKRYSQGFKANVEKYKCLDWNDGELCIRIARTNGELIDEGEILDHCVGGYGESHIQGKDVIFFVRRYRRPERSYYTLDIRFTQGAPYEVQLHGYGNERHGPNKQYRHSIPKKVRAFVDRWKMEVLMPWFKQKAAEQVKKNKKKNLKDKETVA